MFIMQPIILFYVASFAEAWIEIEMEYAVFEQDLSRLLCGGVDWNLSVGDTVFSPPAVASFMEAWIEISDCLSNELNGKHPIK